jgi:Borrelia burgdorferi REV protein
VFLVCLQIITQVLVCLQIITQVLVCLQIITQVRATLNNLRAVSNSSINSVVKSVDGITDSLGGSVSKLQAQATEKITKVKTDYKDTTNNYFTLQWQVRHTTVATTSRCSGRCVTVGWQLLHNAAAGASCAQQCNDTPIHWSNVF